MPVGSQLYWETGWAQGALQATPDSAWVIEEHGYTPTREMGVESRFCVSNGFLGVRGARAASRGPTWVSWLHHLSWASWPRTFVAGLFDTPNTEPAVPALVPAPDWLRFRIVVDGSPLLLRSGELLAHQRTLDMRRGGLLAEWRHRDPHGRGMRLRSLRAVSLAERSLGIQLVQFEIDQPTRVTFEAWLEVTNAGLDVVQIQPNLGVWRTDASGKRLAVASAAELRLGDRLVESTGQVHLTRIWTWDAVPGQLVTFWRLVSFARADGHRHQAPALAAEKSLSVALESGPREVLAAHQHAWAARWTSSDVRIDGDAAAQRALRFAIYHLIGAANPDDERVSIGARALTGDAYLGHVFWDTESYLLPFYTFTWPAAARALLMYRYHTLPAARAKASRMGYTGALYAWESADTGEETTPAMIVGPDGRSVAVLCGTLEQHISADIAYAVWQYWQATEDVSFLLEGGAEMLLETARFWGSRVALEPDGQYHIRDVIGPDEYHEHIDDNAYTNVMAQWNLQRGLDTAALLENRWPDEWRALRARLGLDVDEMAHWRDAAAGLVSGQDPVTGRIEQFAGYFGLEDVDLTQYAGRTVPMDVVLGRERTQASQIGKQADVVMLQALLPDRFDLRAHATNFRYYETRCGHGSSLSRAMHAIVAARLGDLDVAARYFRETAATDLGNANAEGAGGVRIAALGGLWQAAILGFAGLKLEADGLRFSPCLPPGWELLCFRVQWRGRELELRLERALRLFTATLASGDPMRIYVGEQVHTLHQEHVWHTQSDEPRTRDMLDAAA
ncbi:MAG: glycoside hydrolase family 65 protein [Chloroflexota bacterium]